MRGVYVLIWPLVACAGSHGYDPGVPLGLDLLAPVPAGNPLTREAVALGECLFFDPSLSADGRLSCASCHRPGRAFADTVAVSPGSGARIGHRNAPSLLNVVYRDELFWDGRSEILEEQVLFPLTDSLEMDRPIEDIVRQLLRTPEYRRLFARAYGSPPSSEHLARALASYLRTLRSGRSRFDRYQAGDTTALNAEERRGRMLFLGKARCHLCHVGPQLTDGDFHNTGVASGGDPGRFSVTGDSADLGAFRTPSLRDIAVTAPYMHNGSIATLEDVVAFYNRGGGAGAKDRLLRPLALTPSEEQALVAFLRTTSNSALPRTSRVTPCHRR